MVKILAPVGNHEMLIAAIDAGADEVYLGIKEFNMRANAKSFELSELNNIVKLCHDNNVKLNLALNTIIYDEEIEKIDFVLKTAKDAGVDAIICWDMAVLKKAKELGFEIHLSTQASIANFSALKFFYDQGVKRFILARELSLEQLKNLSFQIKKNNLDVELECFVHGAMCVALSGRCFTSQFLYGKSANRGDCIQPCRRRYKVIDFESEDELELENNFVMSAKDLCTINFIDKIIDSGIDVFKIEGRGRSPEYVSTVVSCYREAINAYASSSLDDNLKNSLFKKLKSVYNRKFSSGFFLGKPLSSDFSDLYGSDSSEKKVFVGVVKHWYDKINVAEVELQANPLKSGYKLLVQGPFTGSKEQILSSMQINHKFVEEASKGQLVAIKFDFKLKEKDKVFFIKEKK